MRRACALLLAAALLAGCVHAGGPYPGPQSAVGTDPQASGDFVSTGKGPFVDQPVPDKWWQLYDDPRLDGLIAEAFTANTDLRAAAANIARAQALVAEAQAQGGVQTGTSAGMAYGRLAGAEGAGQIGYSAGFSVSYEVDLGGRLQHLIKAADANAEAAQAAYDLVRVNVAAGVAAAYVDACSAAYQRAITAQNLALQQRSLGQTERLIAAGRGTALDRSRGQVLVEQLRAQLPPLDAAHENALFRLAALLGKPPSQFPRDVMDCAVPPRVRVALPVGDGAALIRRRPDIRAAERTLAAAFERQGLAMSEQYPTIRLGGGLLSSGPLSAIGAASGFGFSLGPLISWSFPNRNIARAHIDEAAAIRQAALARFDGTILNALREVETALTTYAYELQRNAALHAASKAADKAAAQTVVLQAHGRQNALAVLDAERTAAAAHTAQALSDAALASDQVAVFLTLGGGWH